MPGAWTSRFSSTRFASCSLTLPVSIFFTPLAFPQHLLLRAWSPQVLCFVCFLSHPSIFLGL
jgi:hypothetical protein